MMVFLLEPGVPPLLHSLPSLRFSLFIENLKTSKLPLERSDIVASSSGHYSSNRYCGKYSNELWSCLDLR